MRIYVTTAIVLCFAVLPAAAQNSYFSPGQLGDFEVFGREIRSSQSDSIQPAESNESIRLDLEGSVESSAMPPCLTATHSLANLDSKAAGAHKILFYDNDFSYLDDPGACPSYLGDRIKRLSISECRWGTMELGGQFRWRYHHEVGMGQSPGITRFQDNSNDLHLSRLRLYSNWKLNRKIRIYGEAIYAGLDANSSYVPRPTDENYGDFLNLFVDLKLTENGTLRLGRQELLFGAQRLVAPLDWANTRQRFEGVNWIHKSDQWKVDTFFTNYVPSVSNEFDRANYDQSFYGVYSVYKGLENVTLDFYYLGYDHQTVGMPITTDFSLHTLGSRLNGSLGDWLVELESAQQFGRQSGLSLDHTAMFYTAGIGKKLSDLPGAPTLWFFYDYASGNNIGGNFNRFNHLFPLGHKYLGYIDAVQRSNIETPNILFTTKPSSKTKLLVWYYHLMANQDTDSVPSLGGTPAQSTSSKDLGDELDLLFTFDVSPRSQIQLGWSHFWIGNKIQSPGRRDADFFYTQWHLNF